MINPVDVSQLTSDADFNAFLQQRAAQVALALDEQNIATLEAIVAADRENLACLKQEYQRLEKCLRNTVKIACYSVLSA